jgi:hypothetical protein
VNELRALLSQLKAKRDAADDRLNPARAIAAQSRYLVRLYDRFPSLDWVFQAYHGGEAGATRLLRLSVGAPAPGFSPTPLIAAGATYEQLVRQITPVTRPAAFAYLFGRSDDHRNYWWKLLAAERALALYRRDPAAARRRWLALRPGERLEAALYPDSTRLEIATLQAARAVVGATLVRLPAGASAGWRTGDIAPSDRLRAYHYRVGRPELAGLAVLLSREYQRAAPGAPPLVLAQALSPRSALAALHGTTRHPLDGCGIPMPGEAPPRPTDLPARTGDAVNLHAAGLAFDVADPADRFHRKCLAFAVESLVQRGLAVAVDRRDGWHLAPRPDSGPALERIYRWWQSDQSRRATGLRSKPMPGASISTTSPGRRVKSSGGTTPTPVNSSAPNGKLVSRKR